MTPQSNFMIAAPVRPDRLDALRALLATMNRGLGEVDPHNALVPFARFGDLHMARLVILDDQTTGDIAVYGRSFPDAPVYLAFLGDCDGPGDAMLDALAADAGPGLERIFAHCADWAPEQGLRLWMDDHAVRPATQYVNWIGRSVRQIREEAALHACLAASLRSGGGVDETPQQIKERLARAVQAAGLQLSPSPPTPLDWAIADALHLVGGALLLVALIPFLLLYAPFFFWRLRQLEGADPVIAPRPAPEHIAFISAREDWDVTNPFSAVGSLKPGLFRLTTVMFVLWFLDYACRHLFGRGHLARVGTIHFARWVFLDDKRRLFFASNYDRGLDNYMDDFINKAGYGLNLVFSNGVGYPHTDFLLAGGADDEQSFKNFLRRHQVPTDVWYKAYPGLTAYDLFRNARIREGYERTLMGDDEIHSWLALI